MCRAHNQINFYVHESNSKIIKSQLFLFCVIQNKSQQLVIHELVGN